MRIENLPVVVIGAGPSGLAAAAHLLDRGLEPLVLEAGPSAGTAVREWQHVRLFSRWGELIDPAAEKLLAPTGWSSPGPGPVPDRGGLGGALPPAAGRRPRRACPLLGARVTGVARRGRDRVVDAGRDAQPFVVHVREPTAARSGSPPAPSSTPPAPGPPPNPLGADGLPALGEKAAADRIAYRVPDLNDPAVRARYAGKRTAVVGSGPPRSPRWSPSPTWPRPHPAPTSCGSCAAAISATRSAAATPTSCPPAAPSAARGPGGCRRRPHRGRSPASAPTRSSATRRPRGPGVDATAAAWTRSTRSSC